MTPRKSSSAVDSWLAGIATAARVSAVATDTYATALEDRLDAQPEPDLPESTLVTIGAENGHVAIVESDDVEEGKELSRVIVTDTVCNLRRSR